LSLVSIEGDLLQEAFWLDRVEMAMSEDFGLLNLVVSPILERVQQEERLSWDQPPKQRFLKLAKKTEDSLSQDEADEVDDQMSSNHIDLRI
jgi:hypothetical protein